MLENKNNLRCSQGVWLLLFGDQMVNTVTSSSQTFQSFSSSQESFLVVNTLTNTRMFPWSLCFFPKVLKKAQMKRNHYKPTRQATGVVPKCLSLSSTLGQKTAPESKGKLLTSKKQEKLRHSSTGCWQLWWKPQTDNKNDVSADNKPASNYGHCLFFLLPWHCHFIWFCHSRFKWFCKKALHNWFQEPPDFCLSLLKYYIKDTLSKTHFITSWP